MTAVNQPIGLLQWIADHAADFEPPVANKVVWNDSDFIAMVVRGPNARNDFHVDPRDEIFFQLRGEIRVDIIDEAGVRHERRVAEGDIMLVPAFTPHSPLRPADTWGLVIERPRELDEFDELRWYCECCNEIVHTVSFHLENIETELKAALDAFNGDEALRTCGCGCVVPVAQPFTFAAEA